MSKASGPEMKMLFGIAIVAIAALLILMLFGAIGAVRLTDGCLYRYNMSGAGGINDFAVSKVVDLRADGNYTVMRNPVPGAANNSDPASFGKWLNTNVSLTSGQNIKIGLKGGLSLCRGYIPKNNLQSKNNVDTANGRIPIPRVQDGIEPISLVFDAKTAEWRNLVEIFRNDEVIVSITRDKKAIFDSTGLNIIQDVSAVQQYDAFNRNLITADCREDKNSYSPICGRYSIYSGNYVTNCYLGTCPNQTAVEQCYDPLSPWANSSGWVNYDNWLGGICLSSRQTAYIPGPCWKATTASMPALYKYNDMHTFPWSFNLGDLIKTYNPDCASGANAVNDPTYQNSLFFWYSADEATGLLYRLSADENPSDIAQRGSTYNFAKLSTDQSYYGNGAYEYRVLMNELPTSADIQYLQFRYINEDGTFNNNTGGYVLNIKQTKCKRTNGNVASDTFTNRGQVQYTIVPTGTDLNNAISNGSGTYTISTLNPDINGEDTLTAGINGTLWMNILNDPLDYPDSVGQYSVTIFTTEAVGEFSAAILDPLFKVLKDKVLVASKTAFQNMTCYNMGNTQFSSCINFFTYIKAILILYIMTYGMMFLLGFVKISQQDIVIRTVKIALVAGLMNGKTFELFNTYVFDFVTGFSDQIIANMSGYSMFSSNNNVSNPFKFMDALLSKLLFSKTFYAQMLALFAMGISGLLYFIIILISVLIVLITALRAIAVYIMAFLSLAVLIGLAPLFLTFILFDYTRYLFDNWVKFTIRYMLEPTILMAGIIVLTQLYTIYLDIAVGYSVCWKCAIPFKIPFPSIPNFNPAFLNVDLFCINWFAPWGFDSRSGTMGMNMQHIIAIIMLAYCMYGYTQLSSQMVIKLTGTAGPSATDTGASMTNAMENKALQGAGLDANTRKEISQGVKERLGNRKKAVENNRKEIKKSASDDEKSAKPSEKGEEKNE